MTQQDPAFNREPAENFSGIHFYFPKVVLLERWLNEDEDEEHQVNVSLYFSELELSLTLFQVAM